MATKTFTITIVLMLLLSACISPQPVVKTRQYHADDAPKKSTRALNSLQLKALELMNRQQFQQSQLYLQRAIKIDPRDPLNWHYLAQNYWHLHQYAQCREMVQRAEAYSQFDADLQKANRILLQQCSEQ